MAEDIDAAIAKIRPLVPGAEVTWEFNPTLGWIAPSEVLPGDPMVTAVEQAARAREELNALYVAMTRAGRELVISSVAPSSTPAVPTWWQRLLPCATLLPAPDPAHALDAPVGVGKRAVLFGKRRGRQEDVGKRARLVDEQILCNEEL